MDVGKLDADVVLAPSSGEFGVILTFTARDGGEPSRMLLTGELFMRMYDGMGDMAEYLRSNGYR